MTIKTPVYLDYNATTPLDPRVFEAMKPYFLEQFGNAASRHHALGCEAAKAVENAREQVAKLIAADPREIIFTSGATEAINLAIKGAAASSVATSHVNKKKGQHIVTVRTEHKAVLDVCEVLQSQGWDVTYLPVKPDGLIDLQKLEDAINDQTVMVAIMHANNETGVIQPIEKIGRLCNEKDVLFFTDATQSYGKEIIDVEKCHIDLLCLSAHKMYGPKGVGALYVRRKPRVRCEAIIHGGGHERGMRSGTLNVPGIVGLGSATAICQKYMATEQKQIRELRDTLQRGIFSSCGSVILNGCEEHRLVNTLNVSFEGIDGDSLMRDMQDIAVSSSSACTSAALQPSYVLGAMGRSDDCIAGSIRFSLGRFTIESEIIYTIQRLSELVG